MAPFCCCDNSCSVPRPVSRFVCARRRRKLPNTQYRSPTAATSGSVPPRIAAVHAPACRGQRPAPLPMQASTLRGRGAGARPSPARSARGLTLMPFTDVGVELAQLVAQQGDVGCLPGSSHFPLAPRSSGTITHTSAAATMTAAMMTKVAITCRPSLCRCRGVRGPASRRHPRRWHPDRRAEGAPRAPGLLGRQHRIIDPLAAGHSGTARRIPRQDKGADRSTGGGGVA